MVQTNTNLDSYFALIKEKGAMISEGQARRWSEAVLRMLGLQMGKSGKKALSDSLPEELSHDLNRVFRLMHFRNTNLPLSEFQSMVARRGGASDPQYALMAIEGVFAGVKSIVDKNTIDKVAESLAPELREVWEQA